MSEEILRMSHICKSFPGVKALKEVDFSCKKGEVMVLAGENGAGKSTILKILSGLYQADSGEIFFNGKAVKIKNPLDAQKMGIAMVYQELTLVNEMTVAENIYLSIEPTKKFGLVDRKQIESSIQEVMGQYGIELDLQTMVKDLPVAQQQMAEIVKILIRQPELIILDEPTSALARKEVTQLYEIIRSMISMGKTIIFISHRLEEVFEIGDRVTVFKDGSYVDTKKISEITEDDLIRMMVGRSLQNIFPEKNQPEQEIIFQVKNLNVPKHLRDVSFSVRRGEILGIAGLQGHGQTELFNAIYGILPRETGEIITAGESLKIGNAKQAIKQGLALVPADRKNEGLFLLRSIRENLAIISLDQRKKLGIFIDGKKEKKFSLDMKEKLAIKLASLRNEVASLSGGNQQKVVLGKELAINPKVVLFNEPTRGIDVEAKREFYNIMHDLARSGVAVIMYSSDLMEVIGMSNRVAVMYEGTISAVLQGEEITEENIMYCAYGASLANKGERTL